MNLINLPNWEVASVQESEHDYLVMATYGTEPKACVHCGEGRLFGGLHRHGTRDQLLMDMPAHGKRVGILVNRVRYRCQGCGRTFLQPLPDMDPGGSMTKRLVAWVGIESMRRTFTSIADEVGVDEKTVRNIFRSAVERAEVEVKFETPEWLGLDELHLIRKPRCVIVNLKERTLIEVLPDRDKASVIRYLETLDKAKVRYVAIDMWRPYRDAVRKVLPDAQVVVDKWHIQRLANTAMEDVRKSIRASLDDKKRRKLMHDRFLLLRRTNDLPADRALKLGAVLEEFPLLAEAYYLKEGFFDIWDNYRRDQAEAAYVDWKKGITKELSAAFKPVVRAVTNWHDEIFAHFDERVTNACTEALNGLARVANRNGRGYSFEAIRAKMLYSRRFHKGRRPAYGDEWITHDEPTPKLGAIPIFNWVESSEPSVVVFLTGADLDLLWQGLTPHQDASGEHTDDEPDPTLSSE